MSRDIRLCELCSDIFYCRTLDDLFANPRIETHTSLSSLEDSVRFGCYICKIYHADAAYCSRPLCDDFRVSWSFNQLIDTSNLASVRNVRFFLRGSSARDDTCASSMIMFVTPIDKEIVRKYFAQRPPMNDTSLASQQCLSWYNTCHGQHQRCGWLTQNSSWIPTRLIHVSKSRPSTWKLVFVEQGQPGNFKYATLSHMWGHQKPLTLTKQSLGYFCEEQPLSSLPKTFRDAAETVQNLGLEYIWIDSLCIIQDSESDWLEESVKMYKIYAHSACNIVAGSSSHADDGMFRERDGSLIPVYFIQPVWVAPDTFWRLDLGADSSSRDFPLRRRGWFIQEYYLSPRLLIFAKDQVLWQWEELSASERWTMGIPFGFSDYYEEFRLGKMLRALAIESKDRTEKHPRKMMYFGISFIWERIVEHYSESDLTYRKDRLVALAGIAQHIIHFTGDMYIAGLWRSRICESLCWQAAEYEQVLHKIVPRPSPCQLDQAPSWSWASRNSPVLYLKHRRYHSLESFSTAHWARLLDFKAKFLSSSSVGQVEEAHIIIQCRLFEVEIKKTNSTDFLVPNYQCRIRGSQKSFNTSDGYPPDVVLDQDWPDDGAADFRVLYWAVMVSHYRSHYKHCDRLYNTNELPRDEVLSKMVVLQGIILKPVDETAETYIRCGHFGLALERLDFLGFGKAEILNLEVPAGALQYACRGEGTILYGPVPDAPLPELQTITII